MTPGVMPIVEALSWTLIHFLWQGSIVALWLVLLRPALKRRSANLRYLAYCGALFIMLALPVITFVARLTPAGLVETPRWGVSAGLQLVRVPVNRVPAQPLEVPQSSPGPDRREVVTQFAPWLASLWLAGVIGLSLRMLGGWLYTRRLKNYLTGPLCLEWQRRCARLCCEIQVLRPVQILESALVQVPTVIGWMRPVVLLPASALMGLTPRQLEAILAHELAHIRRYDYLVNLLQTAVELLLFYHPAVWWVSREIRRERELCCDDLAVEVCGDPLVYARALAEIESLRNVTPQLAIAANGGSLLARIQRLVGRTPPRPEQSASWIAGATVLAFVLTLTAGAWFLSSHTEASASAAFGETPSMTAPDEDPGAEPLQNSKTSEKQNTKDKSKAKTGSQGQRSTEAPSSLEAQTSQRSGSFIDEMAALGYSNLSVDDWIALKNYGVTAQLVRQLKEQGYDKLSVKELTRVASHGVSPSFIRALQAAGYKNLPLEEVVRAHDHGVSSEFIKEISDLGHTGLALNQVVRMKDHGVDAEFIRALEGAGFTRLPADEIVRARDHGIDAQFIRSLQSAGYSKAPLEQLIRAKDHGVTPEYVDTIKKAGYDNVPLDELIRMHDHGIDAKFLERAKSHGFQKLSIDQLIRLRDANVFD